jgi:hypothetical protein
MAVTIHPYKHAFIPGLYHAQSTALATAAQDEREAMPRPGVQPWDHPLNCICPSLAHVNFWLCLEQDSLASAIQGLLDHRSQSTGTGMQPQGTVPELVHQNRDKVRMLCPSPVSLAKLWMIEYLNAEPWVVLRNRTFDGAWHSYKRMIRSALGHSSVPSTPATSLNWVGGA